MTYQGRDRVLTLFMMRPGAMLHDTQVALTKRMLHHIDHKSTDMLEREAFNNVSTFTCQTQFS